MSTAHWTTRSRIKSFAPGVLRAEDGTSEGGEKLREGEHLLISIRLWRVMRLLFPLLVVCCPAVASSAPPKAPDACTRGRFDEGQVRNALQALPELQKLQTSLTTSQHVAIASGEMNSAASTAGACLLSVAVYIDAEQRFELWHVFALNDKYLVVLVLNQEGDYEPLSEWRRKLETTK